jgi:hypothetical protein
VSGKNAVATMSDMNFAKKIEGMNHGRMKQVKQFILAAAGIH